MQEPATVTPVDCRACDGYGVIYHTVTQSNGEEYEVWTECPACDGLGWTIELVKGVVSV